MGFIRNSALFEQVFFQGILSSGNNPHSFPQDQAMSLPADWDFNTVAN